MVGSWERQWCTSETGETMVWGKARVHKVSIDERMLYHLSHRTTCEDSCTRCSMCIQLSYDWNARAIVACRKVQTGVVERPVGVLRTRE
jgi:hypothetical protein